MKPNNWARWLLSAALLTMASACAAQGALVDAAWLQRQLQDDASLVLLDASPGAQRRTAQVPGSRAAEPWLYLMGDATTPGMERAFRGWGIRNGSRVVVMDQGGSWEAARLFHDLHRHGVAPGRLHLLDGGLAAWRAAGGAVQPAPAAAVAVPPGDVRTAAPPAGSEPGLDEVLRASGEPARSRLVDALEPPYFAGSARFFDRGGHLPQARNWPVSAVFDPERKTFRPLPELRAAAAQLGITPGMPVITYCGGGGAAAVPWFVLSQLLQHEPTRLYTGSAREWVQDERGLPLWTHAQPALMRDTAWATSWASGMLRRVGRGQATLVDVRDAAAFGTGHLPDSVNVPAALLRAQLNDPAALAATFAQAGLDPAHEAVVASEGGLNPAAALAWLALQRAGQRRASLLLDAPERAAELGVVLARQGAATKPRPAAERQPPAPAALRGEPGVPLLRLAMGAEPPAAGALQAHLPWRDLVGRDGHPLPAGEIRARLAKAGVPVIARLEVAAADPGDAAAGLYLLRLMGYADSALASR